MTENLPAWDLSDLYKGTDDPKIADDIKKIEKIVAELITLKGKLASLSGIEFKKALKKYEYSSELGRNIVEFAYLNSVTQMNNSAASAFLQDIQEKLTDITKDLIFFPLEINKIPQDVLNRWSPEIDFYQPWLKRLFSMKKYELSEEAEQILQEKDLTSAGAWVRLYEESSARLKFYLNGKEYNSASISQFTLDKEENVRKEAWKEICKVQKENAHLFTYIYNMVIKDKALEDTRRGFATPVSRRNLSEQVEDKTVETLTTAVVAHYKDIVHRFYKLKAKWLKKDKLNYWDRNAPLPFEKEKKYSWKEAVDIVLTSYRHFSEKLYLVAKDFFDNNWIDVPPRKGKRSGAFCASPSATQHPYLLLNFTGTQHDVLTLAHELGHGCHHQLRIKNGILNEYSRMTSEEVASVFGEMITFQYLLQQTTDKKEKMALIAQKAGDMINTAFRQITFHLFETRAHEERKKGELSTEQLNTIYAEEMRKSFGDSVDFDMDTAGTWSIVGHFFFLPFYVYAYSFADCFVNSLYQVYTEKTVPDFEEKYLNMLSKTAITDYESLLAPFGLNPNSADFWEKGLSLIAHYVDLLEELDKEIE